MQWSVTEAPSIPFELKFVNDIETADDPQQVAPEHIHNHMIPPALLKIVEDVSETILDEFESYRLEQNNLGIPHN